MVHGSKIMDFAPYLDPITLISACPKQIEMTIDQKPSVTNTILLIEIILEKIPYQSTK